ncbi:hypothetical protein Cni_G26899 [Canna indica]|uniref:Senescence regulator n=1 Tax=Canna indica TaxID=4628 RepID=A0AAQ3QQW8_9LILI|nr:hypothetical protein Cni_G26899 [Canna indica]
MMTKSRRHAADRLLGGPHGRGAGGAGDLPDLAEEDVFWGTGGGDCGWRRPEPDRARPWVGRREGGGGGGLSLALSNGDGPRRHAASSAPVEVPVWPSFLRDEPAAGREEEDEEEGRWMPPHEHLAREKGRSSATSSVLEGAGRTLKGRDMSRVRDAVWSRTGFFG